MVDMVKHGEHSHKRGEARFSIWMSILFCVVWHMFYRGLAVFITGKRFDGHRMA